MKKIYVLNGTRDLIVRVLGTGEKAEVRSGSHLTKDGDIIALYAYNRSKQTMYDISRFLLNNARVLAKLNENQGIYLIDDDVLAAAKQMAAEYEK